MTPPQWHQAQFGFPQTSCCGFVGQDEKAGCHSSLHTACSSNQDVLSIVIQHILSLLPVLGLDDKIRIDLTISEAPHASFTTLTHKKAYF